MKSWRVAVTTCVALTLVAVFFLVPLPVNRLRGIALVVPQPEGTHKLYATQPGKLEVLHVRTGQSVVQDESLALLVNSDYETKLGAARAELDSSQTSLRALLDQLNQVKQENERRRISDAILQVSKSLDKARQVVDDIEAQKREYLRFNSPIAGIIGQAPRKEDVGKLVEPDNRSPLITVYPKDRLSVILPLTTSEYNQLVRDCEGDPSKILASNIIIRVHGREGTVWSGTNARLLPSEARDIPLALTSRAGGPVAVQATNPGEPMKPQAQQFLVYLDIVEPDQAILPGNMAQVKIYLRPETCAQWSWRTINNLFELGLFW